MNKERIYTEEFCLTAAQCDATCHVSPAVLLQQLIDVATSHADEIGIGFQRMAEFDALWVLSRVSVEMKRYPGILEEYHIHTWVRSYSRVASERCFRIECGGVTIGYARTLWMAIGRNTRRPVDLSPIADDSMTLTDEPCPIDGLEKIHIPDVEVEEFEYRIGVSDIDFNRHVTSRRYVELALDTMTLEEYDKSSVSRIDINFMRESLCGDIVTVGWRCVEKGSRVVTLSESEGVHAVIGLGFQSV